MKISVEFDANCASFDLPVEKYNGLNPVVSFGGVLYEVAFSHKGNKAHQRNVVYKWEWEEFDLYKPVRKLN